MRSPMRPTLPRTRRRHSGPVRHRRRPAPRQPFGTRFRGKSPSSGPYVAGDVLVGPTGCTTICLHMTHAEQYSTVEPGACPARRRRTRNRVVRDVRSGLRSRSDLHGRRLLHPGIRRPDLRRPGPGRCHHGQAQRRRGPDPGPRRTGERGRLQAVTAAVPDRREPGTGGQGPRPGGQGPGPAPGPGHQRLHELRHVEHGHPDLHVERQHQRYPVRVLGHRHRQCDFDHRPPAHGPGRPGRQPGRSGAAEVPGPGHPGQPRLGAEPGRRAGRPGQGHPGAASTPTSSSSSSSARPQRPQRRRRRPRPPSTRRWPRPRPHRPSRGTGPTDPSDHVDRIGRRVGRRLGPRLVGRRDHRQ